MFFKTDKEAVRLLIPISNVVCALSDLYLRSTCKHNIFFDRISDHRAVSLTVNAAGTTVHLSVQSLGSDNKQSMPLLKKKIVDGSRFFMISAFSRSRLNCCVTYAEADSLIIQILPLCFPSTISEYQMQHFVFYFSFSKHKCAPDKKKKIRSLTLRYIKNPTNFTNNQWLVKWC